MSLKAFHVVFVLAVIALAVGFGWWAWGDGQRVLSAASFACGAVGVGYGIWFLRKLKNVSFL